MARMKKALFVFSFVCCAFQAFGQVSLNHYGIGVSAGDYMPTDSTIRGAFGDNIFTFGLSPVAFGRPGTGSVTPSFNIIGADKSGSNFLLIPVTLGYEYNFGDTTTKSTVVPYARVDAGVSYFNYHVITSGATINGSNVGGVADAELGVEILKDVRLSARYYLFTQESGLSFNGLSLNLTVGIFRF
jgi:hypothetical protein